MDRVAPTRPGTETDPLQAVAHTPLCDITTRNTEAVRAVRRRVLRAEAGAVSVGATPFNSAI
ncbi:hypothetical protein [Phytohabitans kaempferiae]|uniref:FXSXX-COOH protein n=1 Tax=Phytohabitans kaempferiae TaxID=1620943 RepID=A0ABV6MDE8_9ACTN